MSRLMRLNVHGILFFLSSAAMAALICGAQGAEISELVSDLESSDAKKRRVAAYQLNQLGAGAAEAVPALVKALDDDEVQVFFHAVTALARIGPKAEAAVPALVERLGKSRGRYGEQRQIRSAFALSRIGAPAVPALRGALCEKDEAQCATAADALAQMPAEVAAPAMEELVILLGDSRELVQSSVAKAIAAQGAVAVSLLEEIVQDGTSSQKRDAIRALGFIGRDAQSSGATIAVACGERSPEVLMAGLESLVRVRHEERASNILIAAALTSEDADVSDSAANAALLQAQLRPNLDTEPFADAMRGQSEATHLKFADVLGRIGPAAVTCVATFVESAASASKPEFANIFAKALSGIGEPAAAPIIAAAENIPGEEISEDSWHVRAISGMGSAALPTLVEGLKSPSAGSRAVSATGIGLLGEADNGAREALFALLEDPDPAVLGLTLVALPRVGATAEQLMPLLEPLVADESILVRTHAYQALGNIVENPEAALTMLMKGTSDASPDVRASAIVAIGNLGDKASGAVPALKKILESESAEDAASHEATIIALGKVGASARETVTSLAVFLKHDDPKMRSLTLASLAAIGEDAKEALPNIRESLGDRMPTVRVGAVNAMVAIETDPNALTEMLIRALKDDEESVRSAGISALSSLGEKARPAAPRLFALLNEDEDVDTKPILDALRSMRVRDLDLYLSILHHSSPSVRLFACEAIGRFGSKAKKAVPELKKLEEDEYDFVRRRAVQAIERIERRR